MPKSMLLRDIPDTHAEWIESLSHPGLSQNTVVLEMLKVAFENGWTVSEPSARSDAEAPRTFTFIDLFAGIGGFHAGLSAIGGQCVFTSEWDKYAAETYKAWTGEQHVNTDDIRTLDYAADIPDHDVLCGGFPCQPFSIAGVSKKNSLGRKHGFDDERQGNLFFSICDIVAAKRPAILILENVKNLRSHDKGNTFRVISEMIDDLGYEMRAQVIDAQGWVPQHRERIFLVCFDRDRFSEDEIDSFTFPQPPEQGPRLASILDGTPPDRKYMLTDKLWAYLQAYAAKHQAAGNGFGYGLATGKDVARTMSARYYKDGSEILIKQPRWRNPRRLTPAEGARLMGFDERYASLAGHPEGFPQVVSDTQAYKQLGNSVCPHVTEAVGRQALAVLAAMRARTDRSGT